MSAHELPAPLQRRAWQGNIMLRRRQFSTGKLLWETYLFGLVTLIISLVERGMASTMTHVTGTFFLFEMDVLHVVKQLLQGRA